MTDYMRIDGHVHVEAGEIEPVRLLKELKSAGMDGACLISDSPSAKVSASDRLTRLLAWTTGQKNLYPLFWIDPTEGDALEQVEQATRAGVAGFKVICSTHAPGDARAIATFRAIAAKDKPILFHSGILWDGRPSSSFNRPAAFEVLLDVPRLRFSLAHMSWPWVDECVAVYGKFLNATFHHEDAPEMFVDMTPGTPEIYRKDALTKFFTVGYDVVDNMVFGTDAMTARYNVKWSTEWQTRDEEILSGLGVGKDVMSKVLGGNITRWLTGEKKNRKAPKVGQ